MKRHGLTLIAGGSMQAPTPPHTTAIPRGLYHRCGVDDTLTFELIDHAGKVRAEVRLCEADSTQNTAALLTGLLDQLDPTGPQLAE